MIQSLAWLSLFAGWTGSLMLPKTRHGWVLGCLACLGWAVVDWHFGIPAGVVSGLVGLAINAFCWHRKVAGPNAR